MKISIHIPDGTVAASFTYVFRNESGVQIGCTVFDSKDLFNGACLRVPDTIPSDQPPTEKQVEYAKYLGERMCQALPQEFTKEAYSKFISTWKPFVKEEDDAMNVSNWALDHGYI